MFVVHRFWQVFLFVPPAIMVVLAALLFGLVPGAVSDQGSWCAGSGEVCGPSLRDGGDETTVLLQAISPQAAQAAPPPRRSSLIEGMERALRDEGTGSASTNTVASGKGLNDQTSITLQLNLHIKNDGGAYNLGYNKGVMVVTLDDGITSEIAPGTMWHNNIYSVSQMYPNSPEGQANIFCPDSPAYPYGKQQCNGGYPWDAAQVGVVIRDKLPLFFHDWLNVQDPNWGNGVFYGNDANSADGRCRWLGSEDKWECPGYYIQKNGVATADGNAKGSGNYPPGNPYADPAWGGGTGCHFDSSAHPGASIAIDQMDSSAAENLVQDYDCQCNYNYKGTDSTDQGSFWRSWVRDGLIKNGIQKDDFKWRPWFGGGAIKAPQWGMDAAICWVNNMRDMMGMQNQIYWARRAWNDGQVPEVDFSVNRPEQQRRYWGWNEVPVSKAKLTDDQSWEAFVILLPAGICDDGNDIVEGTGGADTPDCLSPANQRVLERSLAQQIIAGRLKAGPANAGNRPGSYVVFARQYVLETFQGDGGIQDQNWQRYFFCYNWVSPSGKWKIVSQPRTGVNDPGACYLDFN